MEYLLIAAAAAVVAAILLWTLRAVTVFEYERGLKYHKGRLEGVLGPGWYWLYRPWSEIRKVDMRPRFVSLSGQEVLSADGVTLKTSLAASYQVTDPETAVNKVENYEQALYLILQFALREIIGQAKIEDVLASRERFGQVLLERSTDSAQQLGLRLLSANVKDVMFPGDLKKIFAQVVQAQKEGQAALEKARGETAALRNLANAARMIEANPSLLQLRLLQQLGGSAGNTVVLGFPTTNTPLPLREQELQEKKQILPQKKQILPPKEAE